MATFAEIKARHESEGTSPDAALKLWLEAVLLFAAGESAGREALSYLTIPFKKDAQWDRRPSTMTFRERVKGQVHIFRSYAKGAVPDNGYAMDPESWELNVERSLEDPHGRGWAVFMRSGGADRSRPVYLKKSTKTGLYFVDGFSNTYLGIRPAKDPNEEEFV